MTKLASRECELASGFWFLIFDLRLQAFFSSWAVDFGIE